MPFEYYCHDCGNRETLETLNENWSCICKNRVPGMTTLHVCSTCNNHRWGLRNSTECEVCFANRLSNKVSVSVEPFGDAVNMKRRDIEKEKEMFEKSYERFEEAKRQSILNKMNEQKAILAIPELLTEISTKLDRVIDEKYVTVGGRDV